MEGIRKAAVAGLFYPGSETELKKELNSLLDENKPEIFPERIFGMIVPHAGYMYSGGTAAFAYNLLRGKKYKTVIVIAPSHREYFAGISLFAGEAYETPLGIIPVNRKVIEKLESVSRNFFFGLIGHGDHEHSLEVQLPFLQTVLEDFELVPIVIGDQSKNFVDELADALADVYDENTIIIASSDLSHFHPKDIAKQLDGKVVEYINDMDYQGLLGALAEDKCEACGGGPIGALMKAASKNNFTRAKVLDICDSGDATGDITGVVGYLSAVIYE